MEKVDNNEGRENHESNENLIIRLFMRKILLYMPYLFMLIRGIILAFISLKFVPFFIGRNVRTNLMFV